MSVSNDSCLIVDKSYNVYGAPYCGAFAYRESYEQYMEKVYGKLLPHLIYKEGSYKQELLYNGKSKDNIKIQYREYKDDFARLAFYQDLMYDLTESKTVAFRNFTMEVIEATNSEISFVIKKD